MSLYKQKNSNLWWVQIWLPGKKRVRKSTGTADRAQAEMIEKTLAMAFGRKTPAAKLHAMIDAVCGHDTDVMPVCATLMDELRKAWMRREKPEQRRKAQANAILRPLDGRFVLPLHAAYYPRPEMAGGPGAFADILDAAGIGGRTFHSWRHTFRTRLSEAGVSDDLAKRLGGWTEEATAARYDHAERIAEMRAAVESGAK